MDVSQPLYPSASAFSLSLWNRPEPAGAPRPWLLERKCFQTRGSTGVSRPHSVSRALGFEDRLRSRVMPRVFFWSSLAGATRRGNKSVLPRTTSLGPCTSYSASASFLCRFLPKKSIGAGLKQRPLPCAMPEALQQYQSSRLMTILRPPRHIAL